MRKKFNTGSKLPVKKLTMDPEMEKAKQEFKKLMKSYRDKPLDDAAVKRGYRIFTKRSCRLKL